MTAADAAWVDGETQVADTPDDHQAELRLWLRLMTCTTLIEQEIRSRLRDEFDFTLPRFDFLAQLDRAPDGLVLGEVSKRLMVSAGNVTAIVERLVQDGYISREVSPADRRVQIVKLTPTGRRKFRRMATRHGEWIAAMFADLSGGELDRLMGLLGTLKGSVRSALAENPALPPHPEVPAKGRPRRTHHRVASFEAPLRGAPQDEGGGSFADTKKDKA